MQIENYSFINWYTGICFIQLIVLRVSKNLRYIHQVSFVFISLVLNFLLCVLFSVRRQTVTPDFTRKQYVVDRADCHGVCWASRPTSKLETGQILLFVF